MAIVLHKPKPTVMSTASASAAMAVLIASLADEVGQQQDFAESITKKIRALQSQLKPYHDKVRQLTELVTAYAKVQGVDPDQEFNESTENFLLEVGKASTVRTVLSVELAMMKLGNKVFFEKASIGLGVLDRHLTPEEKVGIIAIERGVRGVKINRKAM